MSKPQESSIFTTGQVAKICQVAPRTVTKWFDSGQLKGYRIPGSQDRRIPRANLVTFLSSNGIPLGELETHTTVRILIIGEQAELVALLTSRYKNIEMQTVQTTFEAGRAAVRFNPHCVLLDANITQDNTQSVMLGMREVVSKHCPVIGLLEERANDTLQDLFDESFRSPFDMNLLSTRIETLAKQSISRR